MKTVLVTGGAGFFGGILKKELLDRGYKVVSIDLEKDDLENQKPKNNNQKLFMSIQGDIRDKPLMQDLFSTHKFDAVMHCAAILAHAVTDKQFLWSCNVDGTKVVAECAARFHVPKVVFTSSNCLWGSNFHRPVREGDEPMPVEIYGRSKWEAEKILLGYKGRFDTVVLRCPTITDSGRLGLLSILFEFIDEGRRVWVVGGGRNVYQFIYAKDLADACIRAMDYPGTDIFNVGSDDVKSFREVYEYVIRKAGTGARVVNFPRSIAIPLMKIAYALGLSPLGPYQYRMIAEDFVFDTGKIKDKLGWKPTLTNEEMLWKAYEYYRDHRSEIHRRTDVSAHKQAAKMGVIRVLKFLS